MHWSSQSKTVPQLVGTHYRSLDRLALKADHAEVGSLETDDQMGAIEMSEFDV